ncbi:ABC transporter ATP-binding protein [Halobacterium sp. KA-4]|uniref:ABC transporter ATP-binding protein n=1 Tax=Halobacterium sp. KA-4 TaxID=2896367 RepID=UPI001E43D057|nr:ABC transporter ATP-binding protein [Halobacterium sp. KA-4]MCD2201310.1 ABC transporter ATP-binding protein [Halobacterium sp. KA-4]
MNGASKGDDARGTADSSGDTVVSANSVEKTYDSILPFTRSVEVLDGATLHVERGQVVGIMGENGSGKSTLMGILAGVLDHDAGEVERAGPIGWCPQEPRLYDRLTVDETFQLFGTAYGMSDDEIVDARAWLTDVLDFERFRDRQIRHLSGGNRQKVNLSVALMHEPDLLLLDEPYTGFDWETFLAFWDLTEELRTRGVGVAIISHIINERDRFDVVYELHEGHLHRQEIGDDDGLSSEPTDDDVACERTASFIDEAGAGSGQRATAGQEESE